MAGYTSAGGGLNSFCMAMCCDYSENEWSLNIDNEKRVIFALRKITQSIA